MGSSVADVTVEGQPGGGLDVAWTLDGGAAVVTVAVGPSPDPASHRVAVSVPPGAEAVRVAGAPGGRRYVSVGAEGSPPVVAAERRIPFEGVTNFRDLGGYRTGDGERIRWGAWFRADALHGLTRRDLADFETLGVRSVFDLRGEAERAERPDPFPAVAVPLITRRPSEEIGGVPGAPVWLSGSDGEQLLRDVYGGMLATAGPLLGQLFSALADPAQLPTVFHCHGGKDRTGLVAALLLELAGVPRPVVLDDYELTSRYRRREQQADSFEGLIAAGLAPEAALAVLGTPRWAMQQALEEMDATHGGVVGFLTGPGAMDADTLDRLRTNLLA